MLLRSKIHVCLLIAFLSVSMVTPSGAADLPAIPKALKAEIAALTKKAIEANDPNILFIGIQDLATKNAKLALSIADYASNSLTGPITTGGASRSELINKMAAAIASGVTKADPSLAVAVTSVIEVAHPQAISQIFEAIQTTLASAAGGENNQNKANVTNATQNANGTTSPQLPDISSAIEDASTKSASPAG